MRIVSLLLVVVVVAGCNPVAVPNTNPSSSPQPMTLNSDHPRVDFGKWESIFPIESFERNEGPRQFSTTKSGDPLDLWKARGTSITSPDDLCQIELVRGRVGKKHDLGKPVPVDILLWQTAPPTKPYLTKLGGAPYRESNKPWPTTASGVPYTFVAQFCFVDSKDVVSAKLPGDLMLIFFKDSQSCFGGEGDVHIEWSDRDIQQPITLDKCPRPQFTVPALSGVLYRCNEFPESWDAFEQEGHYQYYLFPTTQSSKIGRETYFIQHDPRHDDQQLFCTLNSLEPNKKWPFLDLEELPDDSDQPDEHYGWGKYRMMFGDVGCMYFMIDDKGKVTWAADCY